MSFFLYGESLSLPPAQLLYFRTHKETMKKLKKLLNESSKDRRHRRNNLNIQITILAWIVEFLGFLMIFLGSFILGHDNSLTTLCLQTLTLIVYFIALPSTFLLNGSKLKDKIVDSSTYITFSKLFKRNPIEDDKTDQISQNDEDNVAGDAYENNENNEVSSTNEEVNDLGRGNTNKCSQKQNQGNKAMSEENSHETEENRNKISSNLCVLTEL